MVMHWPQSSCAMSDPISTRVGKPSGYVTSQLG